MLLKCLLSTYIDKSTISKYLENYFNSDNIKLHKVSIFIIGKKYSSFSDIFWNSNENLFEEYRLKKDLYNLIEKNCKQFDYKTISKLLNKIDESNKDYGNNSDVMYMKRLYLHACKALKDDRINSKFEEYSLVNNKEIVDPNITLPIKYETKRDYKDSDELYELKINELIKYLNNYKSDDYPYVGIEYQFQCLIINHYEKYLNYLNEMKELDYRYIDNILYAFYSIICSDKIVFNWDKLLIFINDVIYNFEFLNNSDFKNNIIFHITDILIEGSYSQKTTYSDVNFILVQEILLFLVKKDFDDYKNNSDIISSIVNSSYGSIYNAILSFLLKKGRNIESQVSKQPIIPNDFISVFNNILLMDDEKSFVLKNFISSHLDSFIFYLDKDWTEENIDIIYPIGKENIFYTSMESYFIGVKSFYHEIYKLFKTKGYLDKIIGHTFEDERAYNSFIQNVCFGYFYGIEDLLELSFFMRLLNSLSGNQVFMFIRFLKDLTVTDLIRNKITPLCRILFKILFTKKDFDGFNEAIAESINLLGIIEKIDDEIVEFVIFSIDYINDEYKYFFPDLLLKHVHRSPELVGKIFLKLLNNKYYLIVYKEKIKQLFEIINNNDSNQGQRIQNLYRSKNIDL